MAKHSFKKGNMVSVINQTMSGKFIVEGEARIVSLLDADERYFVRFTDGGPKVERFVDPTAQEDPQGFVKQLNERVAQMKAST